MGYSYLPRACALFLALLAFVNQHMPVAAYGTTGGSRNDGKTDLSLNAASDLSSTPILMLCSILLVLCVVLD